MIVCCCWVKCHKPRNAICLDLIRHCWNFSHVYTLIMQLDSRGSATANMFVSAPGDCLSIIQSALAGCDDASGEFDWRHVEQKLGKFRWTPRRVEIKFHGPGNSWQTVTACSGDLLLPRFSSHLMAIVTYLFQGSSVAQFALELPLVHIHIVGLRLQH